MKYNLARFARYLKYILPLPLYMFLYRFYFRLRSLKARFARFLLRFLNSLAYMVLPANLYIKLRDRAVRTRNQRLAASNNIAEMPAPEQPSQHSELLYVFEAEGASEESEIEKTLANNNLQKLINRDLHEKGITNYENVVFRSDKHSCEVVICCAFTGRYSILKTAILESFGGDNPTDVMWVLVGTTAEDMQFIEAMTITTGRVHGIWHENQPLGKKWQTSVDYAVENIDFELLAIAGSDDIISNVLIKHALDQHGKVTTAENYETGEIEIQKIGMYYINNWLVASTSKYSNITPTIVSCTQLKSDYFIPLGAGRFYTGEFLQAVSGDIFDVELSRLLDDKGYHKLSEAGFAGLCIALEPYPLISVKGEWAMLNSTKDIFLATRAINTVEYTFEAASVLKTALSEPTYNYLFPSKPLNFEWQVPRDNA